MLQKCLSVSAVVLVFGHLPPPSPDFCSCFSPALWARSLVIIILSARLCSHYLRMRHSVCPERLGVSVIWDDWHTRRSRRVFVRRGSSDSRSPTRPARVRRRLCSSGVDCDCVRARLRYLMAICGNTASCLRSWLDCQSHFGPNFSQHKHAAEQQKGEGQRRPLGAPSCQAKRQRIPTTQHHRDKWLQTSLHFKYVSF